MNRKILLKIFAYIIILIFYITALYFINDYEEKNCRSFKIKLLGNLVKSPLCYSLAEYEKTIGKFSLGLLGFFLAKDTKKFLVFFLDFLL